MDEEYEEFPRKGWSSKKTIIMAILIVILIVLIASFFYVNTISCSGPMTHIPVGQFYYVNSTSETTGEIVFGQFIPNVQYDEIVILVYSNNSPSGFLEFPEDETGQMNWVGGPLSSSATYIDYAPGDLEINTGDYIEFDGLSPSTQYYFRAHHPVTDTIVSMTGVTPIISTPPDAPSLDYPGYSSDLSDDFPGLPGPEFDFSKISDQGVCSTILMIAIIVDVFLIISVAYRMD